MVAVEMRIPPAAAHRSRRTLLTPDAELNRYQPQRSNHVPEIIRRHRFRTDIQCGRYASSRFLVRKYVVISFLPLTLIVPRFSQT